jgi:hypothetical protein
VDWAPRFIGAPIKKSWSHDYDAALVVKPGVVVAQNAFTLRPLT